MAHVIVPIATLDAPAHLALQHARSVGPKGSPILAVHVAADRASAARLRREWEVSAVEAELVIIEATPSRAATPLLAYLDVLQSSASEEITIVSQDRELAARLRGRPGVVVESLP